MEGIFEENQIPMTTIILSICAISISAISLIITLVQKARETERNIRKTLTDTLENVTKINIETSKMRTSKDIDHNSEVAATIRRNFNSQRRILVTHADFIVKKFPRIATEIDYNILAGAYAIINDQDRAEGYWIKTVEKSISLPIRHMNLRGLGTFLFNIGKVAGGREAFRIALEHDLSGNDESKLLKVETYLFLADLEKDYSIENYENCLEQAMAICSSIVNLRKREGRLATIKAKMD